MYSLVSVTLELNIPQTLQCIECDSDDHMQVLHPFEDIPTLSTDNPPWAKNGGESTDQTVPHTPVFSTCKDVRGEGSCDKSYAKICLVCVYLKGQPEKAVRLYAILNDQSNKAF